VAGKERDYEYIAERATIERILSFNDHRETFLAVNSTRRQQKQAVTSHYMISLTTFNIRDSAERLL